jgi:hypothetical protein
MAKTTKKEPPPIVRFTLRIPEDVLIGIQHWAVDHRVSGHRNSLNEVVVFACRYFLEADKQMAAKAVRRKA